MTLLLDQNLSHRLRRVLAADYPGIQHARFLGLGAAGDEAIWDYARDHDCAIVSKDVDFHLLSARRGCPPKVIWVRAGNGPTSDIADLLIVHGNCVAAFLADPKAAFLILPPES